MIERQELYCHNCNRYVQFDIDTELEGNHVLTCPICGHEHCRVVKDGIITEDRWDSHNPIYAISGNSVTYSSTSTYTLYYSASSITSTGSSFLYNSWLNSTSN